MRSAALPDLEAMERGALLALWSEVFRTAPPPRLSQPFLRRFLAFELQARRYGGLSSATRAAIEKIADGRKTRTKAPAMKPGARLLREWNGVTHVVEVSNGGFLWQGRLYRSLSAIARAITGAHWSGPRFFGLKAGKGAKP